MHILDVYPYDVETKGALLQMQAYTFYIASCYEPGQVYRSEELSCDDRIWQLLRRLATISRCYEGLVGPEDVDIIGNVKEPYKIK